MLVKGDFAAIRKELKAFEEKREETIQRAREVISLSKQIIDAVHRNDVKAAEKMLPLMKALVVKLDQTQDYETGMANVAFQEYVEAVCFLELVTKDRIPGAKGLAIPLHAYLAGLCDLTGEVARKAVHDAIRKDFDSVVKMKDIVEEIYGEFLQLDLRNGELRKKSDAIKWNLNKREDGRTRCVVADF